MHRFKIEAKQTNLPKSIVPTTEQLNKLVKVLRIKKDEQFEFIDSNKIYTCVFENKIIKVLKINSISKSSNEIILIQAMPKSSKIESIIQKSVELNATKIVFWCSERSISRISKKDFDKKIKRFNKIKDGAIEQSKRLDDCEIVFVESIKDLKLFATEINVVAFEEETKTNFNDLNISKNNIKFSAIIGPEGGFTKKEIEILKGYKFLPITFGKTILRTETASIFILSLINNVILKYAN